MTAARTRTRTGASTSRSGIRGFGMMRLTAEPMIGQRRDDSAVSNAIALPMRQHQFQLRTQTVEHRDPAIDRLEMTARDAIGLRAIGLTLIGERQQLANGGQRKAQLARMPDERQLLPMRLSVAALRPRGPSRRRQQADAFVIADRLDFAAGAAREHTDRHGNVGHA